MTDFDLCLFFWGENHTLKVEVGVFDNWPQLYRKTQEWNRFPGVEYILCMHFSRGMESREYRLFSVANNMSGHPEMPITPTVNPTPVEFNSHRLLGLPLDAPLPTGFAQPYVVVDLWQVVGRLLELIP
ncbi:hypothetical protein BBJ29_006189 [Phytophthora kernoviae]|uniref:Uncharacterized protein n=1 Tax=Phytophthora kernoviae TaxID=325452 RepID=A0A421FIA6_9STRA|nr:hypothetical protein BBJ29_006189 [Phytophthora kernoviae]